MYSLERRDLRESERKTIEPFKFFIGKEYIKPSFELLNQIL